MPTTVTLELDSSTRETVKVMNTRTIEVTETRTRRVTTDTGEEEP
jgi:hypothetical protein